MNSFYPGFLLFLLTATAVNAADSDQRRAEEQQKQKKTLTSKDDLRPKDVLQENVNIKDNQGKNGMVKDDLGLKHQRSSNPRDVSNSQINKQPENKPKFATGRHADTFEGERFNNRGGGRDLRGVRSSSKNDPNFSGGGQNDVSAGKNDEKIYDSGGTYIGTRSELEKSGKEQNSNLSKSAAEKEMMDQLKGGYTDAELDGMGKAQGKEIRGGVDTVKQAEAMKAQQEKELAGPNAKKTPVPDEIQKSTGSAPIAIGGTTLGKEIRKGTVTQGTAGGTDDGRGENENSGTGSGNRTQTETAVTMGATGGQDKEVKRDSGGNINYDKALKANQHTDPVKN